MDFLKLKTMNKECLAEPKDDTNPCIESGYNCYECKHWKYKEIEVENDIPNFAYQVTSLIAFVIAFFGFWLFLNIFS